MTIFDVNKSRVSGEKVYTALKTFTFPASASAGSTQTMTLLKPNNPAYEYMIIADNKMSADVTLDIKSIEGLTSNPIVHSMTCVASSVTVSNPKGKMYLKTDAQAVATLGAAINTANLTMDMRIREVG